MTLSRKILLRNLLLLGGVLVLGTVSLLGMWHLRAQAEVALDEYAELRILQRVALSAASARGTLLAEAPDLASTREDLAAATASLGEYVELQAEAVEGSESHEQAESRTAHAALAELKNASERLARADEDLLARESRVKVAGSLQRVLKDIGRLTRDADALVARTERRAAKGMRDASLAVGGIFLLIVVAAGVIGVMQRRGIVGPLFALSQGVRTIARGNFSQRLPTGGDREFAELAADFNRMAADLEGLYKGLEEKVAAKSRELVRSERLASVGFLAAGVAHEINNPLHIISGYAELSLKRLRRAVGESIAERAADGAAEVTPADAATSGRPALQDAVQSLQIIRDEAFRCKQITEKLLSLSKPGTDHHEPLSLSDLARDVTSMVRAHKAYRDLDLDLKTTPDEPLMTRGNEAELKQVLLNLTVNALESVEAGRGKVTLGGERRNGWVELHVADNGCGMSEDVKERIFEPFYTRKPGGQRGLGLGLSISHAIIAGHRGAILAESDGPGRGSRFTVRLPALDHDSGESHPGGGSS